MLAMTVLIGGILALSGRWADPWLWGYGAVWATLSCWAVLGLNDNLAKERFTPPTQGADRVPLQAIRVAALAHITAGALDVGRWHLSDTVPVMARSIGLAGMAIGATLIFRAMHENHFFSSVVRIQHERGHRVVDTGPYAVVRHPGYAGMIVAMPFSGLALGSWVSVGCALVYSALILRRVFFEDAFLRTHLDGYQSYAQRVPARLVPAVW